MLLIATLVRHPGVGYQTLDPSENYHSGKEHNALTEVQERVRELAATLALALPAAAQETLFVLSPKATHKRPSASTVASKAAWLAC